MPDNKPDKKPDKKSEKRIDKAVRAKAEKSASRSVLARFAGALLLAAALFALAALVAFSSLGRHSPWGWSFAVLGLLLLGGWFLGRRGQGSAKSDEYSRARALLGVNSIVSVLLLLVLLVGVNYIGTRRHKVLDLTQNRINSLSPQTVTALGKLKKGVRMVYVWAPSEYSPQIDPAAQSVLEAYKDLSDKVQVEFVNAAQDQLRVQSMNITSFTGQPMLIVEPVEKDAAKAEKEANAAPSARQEVSVIDEQNITSAVLKIAEPKARVLYFLSGHGEQSPVQVGAGGQYNSARAALEGQNYTLKSLALTGGKAVVPKDAAAVVAMGPRVDLSAGEASKLTQYLKGKGRLVLLLDLAPKPLPRWKGLLKTLNLEMVEGLVLELDPQRSGGNPQVVAGILDDPSKHPLLRGVSGSVLFPGLVPLRAVPTPQSAPGAASSTPTVTPLFESSINSSALTTLNGNVKQLGEGPFVIAAAITKGDDMRAVVVGNSSFASDGAFNQFGNASFFLSAVNWVVGNDSLVTIPPKKPVTNTISLTAATRTFVIWLSLVLVPLGALVLGTVVWWKRR